MSDLYMGSVIDSEVDVNTEGDDNVRLLSVEITDEEDNQTVELVLAGGIDYNPADGATAFVSDAGESYKIATGIDDGIEPEAERGEIEIYATSEDGATKESRVKCVNDGTVEVNGDSDFAVRFTKLQEAFNQLQSDHDDLVDIVNTIIQDVTIFSGAYVPGGPVAVGTPPVYLFTASSGAPSTADIDPSKVEEVKLP